MIKDKKEKQSGGSSGSSGGSNGNSKSNNNSSSSANSSNTNSNNNNSSTSSPSSSKTSSANSSSSKSSSSNTSKNNILGIKEEIIEQGYYCFSNAYSIHSSASNDHSSIFFSFVYFRTHRAVGRNIDKTRRWFTADEYYQERTRQFRINARKWSRLS